jgi:nucleoside-diphosphate-sugar epimerase
VRATSLANQIAVAETAHACHEIVEHDLRSIASRLTAELGSMTGSRLLVTGGAGIPGYHSVQAIHQHNPGVAKRDRALLTAFDDCVRAFPRRLSEFDDRPGSRFVEHDPTLPFPADMDDFEYVIHLAAISNAENVCAAHPFDRGLRRR